jgi:hypothetical protein
MAMATALLKTEKRLSYQLMQCYFIIRDQELVQAQQFEKPLPPRHLFP